MDKSAFLNRPPATHTFDCKATGGPVTVRKLTGKDADELNRKYLKQPDGKEVETLAFIVVRGLADDAGRRLLDDGDMAAVKDRELVELKEISDVVLEFSGLKPPEEQADPKIARLAGDADRLAAMRLALAFGRPDVDELLDELTAEQVDEWTAYLTLNPTGWEAQERTARRIAYVVALTRASKPIKERSFKIETAPPRPRSTAGEAARWEAAAIRSRIEKEVADGRQANQ